jgi:hypothetical protein
MVVAYVKSVQCADGWGLSSLYCGLSLRHIPHLLYYVPYHQSLKNWCDDSEPQEERMITLLRTVNSRRWKNSSSVHFECHLVMDYGL